jgi:hypothetical protein
MPRKPVTFLNKEYKTQKEFEKYVKKIIYNDIGICNDVKNTYQEKYYLLIKILERHPNFNSKTENMCNIKIVCDTLNKKALKILIIKNDGSNIDISWRCAITGKPKSKKFDLMSAMRSSLDSQIYQFRIEHNNDCCELCGNTTQLDVDHDDTKNSAFDELVFNFLKKNNDIEIPDKFEEVNDNTHRRKFLEKNNVFKDKWIEYHNKHASLRMLCHTCNISRPKTKNKIVL